MYTTVARPIPSVDVSQGGPLREESLSGFILVLTRDAETNAMLVNGLPCIQVSL